MKDNTNVLVILPIILISDDTHINTYTHIHTNTNTQLHTHTRTHTYIYTYSSSKSIQLFGTCKYPEGNKLQVLKINPLPLY